MVQGATWTTPYRVPNTLLNDTEESVVGTQLHQDTFMQLADMLRDIDAQRDAGWGVCTQIALAGLLHEDGTAYDPMPDLMVLRHPLTRLAIATVRLDDVGVPLFIGEVVSNSTKSNDTGEKRRAYEAIGVPEYMVIDLTGDHVPSLVQAWMLVDGIYQRWLPDADGWWHSTTLEVALQPGHPFMRVRDRNGVELAPSGLIRQQAREEARRRALTEQQLAEEARRRALTEQQLAEEAHRRALTEQQLAEEARRRAELEDLVEQLRSKLTERDDRAQH